MPWLVDLALAVLAQMNIAQLNCHVKLGTAWIKHEIMNSRSSVLLWVWRLDGRDSRRRFLLLSSDIYLESELWVQMECASSLESKGLFRPELKQCRFVIQVVLLSLMVSFLILRTCWRSCTGFLWWRPDPRQKQEEEPLLYLPEKSWPHR